MINDIQITKNSNENNKIDSTCGNCKRTTKHIIHSEICVNGSQEMHPYEGTYHWSDEYQIIQCQGCETFSFRKTHQNSDDICQTYNGDFEPELFIDVYPNPEEGRKLVNDYDLLPSDLYRIYVETIKSINSNLPVLTGIGIRAIVETVCKNQKANGKNLLDKIDDLVTQGVLTKDGANILHKLRTLGNEAAHEVKPHKTVQLGLALDVIDHLLQGVYILPHHAKNNFK